MASWIRINDTLTINADQVTHVQFHEGDAFVWFAYCIEDEEHGFTPDALLLEGAEAERFARYLARRGDDVRLEG